VVTLDPGVELRRRLFLIPGSYAISASASRPIRATLDGEAFLVDEATRQSVEVYGLLHEFRLEVPGGGFLRAVAIMRVRAVGVGGP
jgi:hypothetical protein